MRDYSGEDNYGRPKQEYIARLKNMSEDELHAEIRQMIYLAAYASNNPKSAYHWQCDACYDEWTENRKDSFGYSKAYKDEYAANFGD